MDGSALVCPYCGHENEAAALARHRSEVRGIYARIARLFHLPAERAKKVTNGLVIGAAALVALTLLALAAAFVYSRVAPGVELKHQQETVARMEELYAAGDYESLGELVEETDNVYRAVYDKYTTVHFLYQNLTAAEQGAAETAEFIAGFPEGADLLDYDLENLFEILAECDALEAAGFVYGEGRAVTEFRGRAEAVLKDVLLLTDSEVSQGVSIAAGAMASDEYIEPDYSDLRDIAAGRICGGSQ